MHHSSPRLPCRHQVIPERIEYIQKHFLGRAIGFFTADHRFSEFLSGAGPLLCHPASASTCRLSLLYLSVQTFKLLHHQILKLLIIHLEFPILLSLSLKLVSNAIAQRLNIGFIISQASLRLQDHRQLSHAGHKDPVISRHMLRVLVLVGKVFLSLLDLDAEDRAIKALSGSMIH